jgi:hypothetical protein
MTAVLSRRRCRADCAFAVTVTLLLSIAAYKWVAADRKGEHDRDAECQGIKSFAPAAAMNLTQRSLAGTNRTAHSQRNGV